MPNADYALQLVRRGYVVLAPDLRCFGERLDWNPEDHYACDTNLVHAAMAGWNPLAQNIWDLRRSLDVLEQHPLVDPARLGMVGISYGGTVTLFTAAVDTRVAASVVSGYFSSWAVSHKMPWNMCGSQVLFGMLGRLEHEDLGALVAPRPLLVESGTEDDLFPFATAAESVRRTRLVYEQLGAGDRLVHDIFEGGHQWHGTEALPFLDRWLGHAGALSARRPESSGSHSPALVVGPARSRASAAWRRTWSSEAGVSGRGPELPAAAAVRPPRARTPTAVGSDPRSSAPVAASPAGGSRPASARPALPARHYKKRAQDVGEGGGQHDGAVHVPVRRDRDRVGRGHVHEGQDGGDRRARARDRCARPPARAASWCRSGSTSWSPPTASRWPAGRGSSAGLTMCRSTPT